MAQYQTQSGWCCAYNDISSIHKPCNEFDSSIPFRIWWEFRTIVLSLITLSCKTILNNNCSRWWWVGNRISPHCSTLTVSTSCEKLSTILHHCGGWLYVCQHHRWNIPSDKVVRSYNCRHHHWGEKLTMKLAFVTPKSNKAKNRFSNLMEKHPGCIIEQIVGNRVFLRSHNGKNFFWVDINNDAHWGVVLG